MQITCVGASGGIVTGSCYLLEVAGEKHLFDCGEFQGSKETSKKNYDPFPFEPATVDHAYLSHAHIDHCGRLPKLAKEGFDGPIYATPATVDLAKIQHEDSARIHEAETRDDNRRIREQNQRIKRKTEIPEREPLFSLEDAYKALNQYVSLPYGLKKEISDHVTVEYFDAGHILGSALIKVTATEDDRTVKIIFGYDLGQKNTPIIRDPSVMTDADYVFIESTYGGKLHDKPEEKKQKLLDILNEAYQKKGPLLIPSFAIERTQELLFHLNGFHSQGLMPDMNVYVDSPLASKATKIFTKHPECYDDESQALLKKGGDLFSFPGVYFTDSKQQSMQLNYIKGPFVVIAGSGMCNAGRIRQHFMHHIGKSNTTVLFVGYQAVGTTGWQIQNGRSPIRLYGQNYHVEAKIHTLGGFSAHADQKGLLEWVESLTPSKPTFFIVHGEDDQRNSLEEKLQERGARTYLPELNETMEL